MTPHPAGPAADAGTRGRLQPARRRGGAGRPQRPSRRQVAQESFQPAAASINSADGPLAVFWFRLDPSVAPGDVFDLTLDTTQTKLTDAAGKPITLAPRAGTLTIRAPQDPRYGQSISTVDASQPGRLVVEFQSSDSSFNSVPGTVVAISATMAADAPAGAVPPFAFDREGTWLLDPQGNRIALALGDGMLQIQ